MKSFLNEIDLNRFNSNKLGVFDYSLTVEDEEFRTTLLLDIDARQLKYTFFEK